MIVLSAVDRQPLNLTDNVVSVIVEACSTLFSRGERWLDVKCILPERTALCGENVCAWHHVLPPFIYPIRIFLQIRHHHHTEEINIDLQLQDCAILLNTALSIAALDASNP